MKYYCTALMLSVSMLGAMEKGAEAADTGEGLHQEMMRHVFALVRTVNQFQTQQGGGEWAGVSEFPRTYLTAYGRPSVVRVTPRPACILCYKLGLSREELAALPEEHIDKYAVVKRFDEGTVLFVNQMPYCDGHCLVLPETHVAHLRELSSRQRREHHDVVDCALPLFKRIFNVPGFNDGLNDGEWAGSSVVEHAHTHILPRMREGSLGPVANTIVRSRSPKDVFALLHGPFSRLNEAFHDGQDPSEIDIDRIISPDDDAE